MQNKCGWIPKYFCLSSALETVSIAVVILYQYYLICTYELTVCYWLLNLHYVKVLIYRSLTIIIPHYFPNIVDAVWCHRPGGGGDDDDNGDVDEDSDHAFLIIQLSKMEAIIVSNIMFCMYIIRHCSNNSTSYDHSLVWHSSIYLCETVLY